MRTESLERDIAYLKDMAMYCDKALSVISKANKHGIPLDDDMVIDAIAMNLGQIGEQLLVGRLSEATRERFSDRIEWSKIKAFRNFVYHDYGRVSFVRVKQLLDDVVPVTREQLVMMIRQLEKEFENE